MATAGCSDDAEPVYDDLRQQWWVNIRGDGQWAVRFPLLVHYHGPTLETWRDLLRVSIGSAEILAEDDIILVRGTGFVVLEAVHRQQGPGNLEGYLDAEWSDGQGPAEHGKRIKVQGSGGIQSLSLRLEAVSKWCSLEAGAAGTTGRPGPFDLDVTHAGVCRGQ